MTPQLSPPTHEASSSAVSPAEDSATGGRTGLADRLLALTGAGFVVAALVGNSLTESAAGTDESPAGTARELAAGVDSTAVSAGLAVELVGLVCLAVFGVVLTARTAGRVRVAALPLLMAVAASLVVAIKLASAAPYLAARAAQDELPDGVLHALVGVNGAAFVVCWIPMALLVGAAAAALHQADLVGRIVAGAGAVLAVAGLALGILGALAPADANPVAFLLSLLWLAAASLQLALRRDGQRRQPTRTGSLTNVMP